MCHEHEKTTKHESYTQFTLKKGKAILLQAWRGPEVSRRLRLPDFMMVST